MTNEFAALKDYMDKNGIKINIPYLETQQVQAVVLCQIATSLIDIEKDLKRIEEQLKKRRV